MQRATKMLSRENVEHSCCPACFEAALSSSGPRFDIFETSLGEIRGAMTGHVELTGRVFIEGSYWLKTDVLAVTTTSATRILGDVVWHVSVENLSRARAPRRSLLCKLMRCGTKNPSRITVAGPPMAGWRDRVVQTPVGRSPVTPKMPPHLKTSWAMFSQGGWSATVPRTPGTYVCSPRHRSDPESRFLLSVIVEDDGAQRYIGPDGDDVHPRSILHTIYFWVPALPHLPPPVEV